MVVIDCSAAMDIIQNTERGAAYRSLMLENERIIAPSIYIDETCNALWKYVIAGFYTTKIACDLLERAVDLVDEFYSDQDLMKEVLADSVRLQHPVYDVFYLVLAKREGATLFSSDKKLVQYALENCIDCVSEIDLDSEE